MMYVICDKQSGIIENFSENIAVEDTMFHDITNGIYYPNELYLHYEFEDVPKYVRIGDWKYTESGGFERSFDPQQVKEMRMNQYKRYTEMVKAMEQYDTITEMNNMIICATLEQQLYH